MEMYTEPRKYVGTDEENKILLGIIFSIKEYKCKGNLYTRALVRFISDYVKQLDDLCEEKSK